MHSVTENALYLVLAGSATALACGLGAVPVFILGKRLNRAKPALRGMTAGLMAVAAVIGLLRPALRSGGADHTVIGVAVGVVFVLLLRRLMHGREVKAGGFRRAGVRHMVLIFAVLFFHSLPEGMAIGAAHASGVQNLNLFVLAAIALQNVPEGTVMAIPMAASGFGKSSQFWGAVLTSLPQPIGAPLAYVLVDVVRPMLPISLALAGGAMLAVVVVDLVPEAFRPGGRRSALLGATAGAAVMLVLNAALGVGGA